MVEKKTYQVEVGYMSYFIVTVDAKDEKTASEMAVKIVIEDPEQYRSHEGRYEVTGCEVE